MAKELDYRLVVISSNIKMVGTETVYRVQDRPSRSNSNKVADYQLELATGLLVWATRLSPLENVMKLPTATDRNAAVVGQVGLVQDQLWYRKLCNVLQW